MSSNEDPIAKMVQSMVKEAMMKEDLKPITALGITFDGGSLGEMQGVYRETEDKATMLDSPVPVTLLYFRDLDGTPMRPVCLDRKNFKKLLEALISIDEEFALRSSSTS